MNQFTPCKGKDACRDDGTRCLTCGRSFEEITRLRDGLDQLASLAVDYQYENGSEYTTYIAQKLEKMIAYRNKQQSD